MSRKPTSTDKPEIKDAALKYASEAVATLVELMRNSGSDPVRIAAARELIDRAYCKPKAEPAGEGQSLQDMVRAAFEREEP